MKHIITLTLALPFLALAIPACDSPDDEAELQALDVAEEEDLRQDLAQADEENPKDQQVDELDLKANMSTEGPPGKCCKAKCSWDPYNWRQLPPPYQMPNDCNYWASWWCVHGSPQSPGPGLSHLEDAQWRTCG